MFKTTWFFDAIIRVFDVGLTAVDTLPSTAHTAAAVARLVVAWGIYRNLFYWKQLRAAAGNGLDGRRDSEPEQWEERCWKDGKGKEHLLLCRVTRSFNVLELIYTLWKHIHYNGSLLLLLLLHFVSNMPFEMLVKIYTPGSCQRHKCLPFLLAVWMTPVMGTKTKPVPYMLHAAPRCTAKVEWVRCIFTRSNTLSAGGNVPVTSVLHIPSKNRALTTIYTHFHNGKGRSIEAVFSHCATW